MRLTTPIPAGQANPISKPESTASKIVQGMLLLPLGLLFVAFLISGLQPIVFLALMMGLLMLAPFLAIAVTLSC